MDVPIEIDPEPRERAGPSGCGASVVRLLVVVAVLVGMLVAVLVVGLVYVGAVGPDTAVYTGNQVPRRFLDIARRVGALEEGERLLYFYSDAFVDIKEGFYFVSDRKVVIYSESAGETPLTSVPFDAISDLEIDRNESFFIDSEITLYLKDGQVLSFPVSSEHDKDEAFFDAIRQRVPEEAERELM
jgi:hypothetical protein